MQRAALVIVFIVPRLISLLSLSLSCLSVLQEHGRAMEYDDSKIDDDLDKLLQTIKVEHQNSMVRLTYVFN